MVKIKLNLFEAIVGAVLLPNIGFVFTTFFLIMSLLVKQSVVVYKGIIISYVACLALMIFSITACALANKKSTKEFILYDNEFKFLDQMYSIEKIRFCEYYVCKWYVIPIACIYKQQAGGLMTIKLNTGEKIQFKLFYKDYLKLKNRIQNIIEK